MPGWGSWRCVSIGKYKPQDMLQGLSRLGVTCGLTKEVIFCLLAVGCSSQHSWPPLGPDRGIFLVIFWVTACDWILGVRFVACAL